MKEKLYYHCDFCSVALTSVAQCKEHEATCQCWTCRFRPSCSRKFPKRLCKEREVERREPLKKVALQERGTPEKT